MRHFSACLILFLLMLGVSVPSQCEEDVEEPLFPVLYSKNPEKPLDVVATKVLTKADQGRNESSQEAGRPFGASTRELARIKVKADKGPLYLNIEYAGVEKYRSKTPDHDRYVIVNLRVECPEIQGKCYTPGPNTWNQELFFVATEDRGGMPVREVEAHGKKIRLMASHTLQQYRFLQDTPVVFYAALSVPENIETDQLRFTFMYGDPVTEKPPRGPLRAGANGSVIASVFLMILIGLWARNWSGLETVEHHDSPKIIGILLSLLGLLLACGGVYVDLLYFLVIGFMMTITGCLLFFGRAAALWFYGITLVTIWIWSGLEVGPAIKPVLVQVTLPSLIGLYLYFSSVSDRLRN